MSGELLECVIASQRVRAKRGPMTGSAKQSITVLADKWIASSQGLLAITGKELHVMSRILSQTLSG
jgi:hypothetical protein